MADIQNKKIKPLPYDENFKSLSGLVLPIVDGSGNITGWAPVATVVLPDGTLSLKVTSTITVESADIDIGDIHLLDTSNTKINPATEETLTSLETLVSAAREASTGKLRVSATGEVSSVNSTATPLGISQTFTGTFEDTLSFSHVSLSIIADQASATNGLIVEWSSDGTNVDSDDTFTIAANNGKVFTFGTYARFFRVRYINGTVAQTIFRLQSIKKAFSQKPSSHRLSDSIVPEDDAELVKSVLTGQSDAGPFLNVRVSDDGFLRVVTPPPEAPPDSTAVKVTVQSSVAGSVDTVIPITSGKTLTLQLFGAGAQQISAGSKASLYEDPTGTGTPLNLVSTLYVDGSSDNIPLSDKFVGDGVRQLIIRRAGFTGSGREITAFLRGFEK